MEPQRQPDQEYPKLLECPLCDIDDTEIKEIDNKWYGICKNQKCQAITLPYDTKLEAYDGWNIAIGIHSDLDIYLGQSSFSIISKISSETFK